MEICQSFRAGANYGVGEGRSCNSLKINPPGIAELLIVELLIAELFIELLIAEILIAELFIAELLALVNLLYTFRKFM
jgi:hypothetical protein